MIRTVMADLVYFLNQLAVGLYLSIKFVTIMQPQPKRTRHGRMPSKK